MANIRQFISYVRDQQGVGIGDALVQAYAITDLNSNNKSATSIAETYPDSTTGRWLLNVDLDNSPTGYVSFKISRGNTVRWIEGDVVMQAMNFMGDNGTVPLPDNSISDEHLGNRTLDQEVEPSGHTATITGLFSRLANRIRAITGESNWYSAPIQTLRQLNDKFSGTTNPGHNHSGEAGQGPKLVPETSLTWIPAQQGHNHDDRYALKGSDGGGGGGTEGGTADDSTHLGGIPAGHFAYVYDALIPNFTTNVGPHKIMIGTSVVTTNSFGSAWINYPRSFPNATRWINVTIGGGGYRGSVVPVATSRSQFEIRLGTDEARQVRINWWAIGN